MHTRHTRWIAALAVLLTAACGGGGGDAGTAPAPATTAFTFQAAFGTYALTGSTTNYSVSGICSGSATLTEAPAITATFEGIGGYSVDEVATITLSNCTPSNGAGTSTTRSTTYYDGNFSPLGSSTPGEEYERLQTAPVPLPATVRVGDTAQIGTLTLYADSTKSTVTGSRALSYVVEVDSTTSAIVNLIVREYDTSNRLLYTQQTRYRITSDGVLSPVSIGIQDATGSTTGLLLTKI